MDAAAQMPALPSAALTLNPRGMENALQSATNELVCFVSASEAHSQPKIRRSHASSVALVARAVSERNASAPQKLFNTGIAMALGCSISGPVAPQDVLRRAGACLDAGADTVGYAGPRQIGQLCAAKDKLCVGRPFIVHLHDTRGMGIANAAAAL